MSNSYESCLAKILKVIDILQRNSNDECHLEEGCTKPFLGFSETRICYNTRPITLYTKCGDILTVEYDETSSSIFRVEKVNDNCCTLRILEENRNATDQLRFTATNQFVTVDLKCICALKCLPDVVVENL